MKWTGFCQITQSLCALIAFCAHSEPGKAMLHNNIFIAKQNKMVKNDLLNVATKQNRKYQMELKQLCIKQCDRAAQG